MLVGAYALAAHGFPRATKDIDLFVWATPENADRLMRALDRFGAPLDQVTAKDFSTEGVVFQIGSSPRRVDIVTRIDGVRFDEAYANRTTVRIQELDVPVLSIQDLIRNKRASGRAQDVADVERLESVSRE